MPELLKRIALPGHARVVRAKPMLSHQGDAGAKSYPCPRGTSRRAGYGRLPPAALMLRWPRQGHRNVLYDSRVQARTWSMIALAGVNGACSPIAEPARGTRSARSSTPAAPSRRPVRWPGHQWWNIAVAVDATGCACRDPGRSAIGTAPQARGPPGDRTEESPDLGPQPARFDSFAWMSQLMWTAARSVSVSVEDPRCRHPPGPKKAACASQ